jgi:hypothetical protein
MLQKSPGSPSTLSSSSEDFNFCTRLKESPLGVSLLACIAVGLHRCWLASLLACIAVGLHRCCSMARVRSDTDNIRR